MKLDFFLSILIQKISLGKERKTLKKLFTYQVNVCSNMTFIFSKDSFYLCVEVPMCTCVPVPREATSQWHHWCKWFNLVGNSPGRQAQLLKPTSSTKEMHVCSANDTLHILMYKNVTADQWSPCEYVLVLLAWEQHPTEKMLWHSAKEPWG